MVKLGEDVKKLFADMRSMAAASTPAARKIKLKAEVHRLIELVDINSVNSAGETILMRAVANRDVDLVRLLLHKGAHTEAKAGKNSLNPLLAASVRGNVEIMKALVDGGADLQTFCTTFDGEVRNALHLAIRSRSIEAVKFLLANGLKTYHRRSGSRPLNTAGGDRSKPDAPMLLFLIEQGVGDVSAVDEHGQTALQSIAALYSECSADITESLAVLLDHGTGIDQLSREGQSALHIAVDCGTIQAVSLLLDRGANVALADRDGQTALHKATNRYRTCSSVEMVTALLAHGALVDAVDGEGRTPLHDCAAYSREAAVPIARVLLQAGANVNATNDHGDGALHFWAKRSRNSPSHEFAQLLIDHGADVAAYNKANQRPSDVAARDGPNHTFLLAAEEAQRNNHRYKRPRLEDLQPPAIAPGAEGEAAAAAEEEDETEDDSDDEDDEEEDE
jgi:ankyrin repeat protein